MNKHEKSQSIKYDWAVKLEEDQDEEQGRPTGGQRM